LGDSFDKDVQVGDEVFDKQFRVKSKKPNFIRAVLKDAKLRSALISQKNIRIKFNATDDEGATLEITSYVHSIDIDEVVFRVAIAVLRTNIGQLPDGSEANA